MLNHASMNQDSSSPQGSQICHGLRKTSHQEVPDLSFSPWHSDGQAQLCLSFHGMITVHADTSCTKKNNSTVRWKHLNNPSQHRNC